MSRPCSVCQHGARDAIDHALLAGDMLTAIAAQHALTVSALGRHRDKHLPAAMVKAAEVLDELRAGELVARASDMFRAIERQMKKAEADGDHKAVAMLAGQGTKVCQLLMKRFDQMPPERSVSIVASVE